jgi:hypothetical protein
MGNVLVGGIYVVQTKKGDQTEYWAAATIQEKAVAAVEKQLVVKVRQFDSHCRESNQAVSHCPRGT